MFIQKCGAQRVHEASESGDGASPGSLSVNCHPSRVLCRSAARVSWVRIICIPCPFVKNLVASEALEYWVRWPLVVGRNQMGALRGLCEEKGQWWNSPIVGFLIVVNPLFLVYRLLTFPHSYTNALIHNPCPYFHTLPICLKHFGFPTQIHTCIPYGHTLICIPTPSL